MRTRLKCAQYLFLTPLFRIIIYPQHYMAMSYSEQEDLMKKGDICTFSANELYTASDLNDSTSIYLSRKYLLLAFGGGPSKNLRGRVRSRQGFAKRSNISRGVKPDSPRFIVI